MQPGCRRSMDRVKWPLCLFFLTLVPLQALGHVEPPTNVTLHCRNLLDNVVKWTYDQPPPGLRYKVVLRFYTRPPVEFWVDPPNLQIKLSTSFTPEEDYLVNVTAVLGNDESEPAPPDGIDFSYFMDSLVTQKCIVDLPLVNVTAQKDNIVHIRFIHPWLFHHTKSPDSSKLTARKPRSQEPQLSEELPEFKYDVVLMNQKEEPLGFSCMESVCEETLPVDAAQQTHCLQITGEMKKMSVYGTQDYCSLPLQHKPDANYIVYIILGCASGLSVLVLILVMVYKKKTAPSSSSSLPNFMHVEKQDKRFIFGFDPEQVNVAEVEPHSPTPLLHTTDMIENPPVFAPDMRLPIGVSPEDQVMCEDDTVQDEAEGSEYMPGRGLEEDEAQDFGEFGSGYESRRPVIVDLGQDEHAEGYRA